MACGNWFLAIINVGKNNTRPLKKKWGVLWQNINIYGGPFKINF